MNNNKRLYLVSCLSALIAIGGLIADKDIKTNHLEKECNIARFLNSVGMHEVADNHTVNVINRDTKNTGISAEIKEIPKRTCYFFPAVQLIDENGRVTYLASHGGVITGNTEILTIEKYTPEIVLAEKDASEYLLTENYELEKTNKQL